MRTHLYVLVFILTAAAITRPSSDASAAPLTCDGERVTIEGTGAGEVLTGTPRRDVIHGRGGDDTIRGLFRQSLYTGPADAPVPRQNWLDNFNTRVELECADPDSNFSAEDYMVWKRLVLGNVGPPAGGTNVVAPPSPSTGGTNVVAPPNP